MTQELFSSSLWTRLVDNNSSRISFRAGQIDNLLDIKSSFLDKLYWGVILSFIDKSSGPCQQWWTKVLLTWGSGRRACRRRCWRGSRWRRGRTWRGGRCRWCRGSPRSWAQQRTRTSEPLKQKCVAKIFYVRCYNKSIHPRRDLWTT